MKRTLISLAALAVCAALAQPVKRARTRDVAFSYRMGAGFPGDVNRTHPFSVLPGLMDAVDPVAAYGFPVVIDPATNSYRGVVAADRATLTKIDGILVRPFPTQQTTGGMTSTLGAATPPTSGVIDVLEDGFIIAKCNNFGVNPPTKGGAVYVWAAASAGNHVLGGFEAAADGANTALVTNAYWNGPTDSAGITEIQVFRK